MTSRGMFNLNAAMVALSLVLFGYGSFAAEAKQTSLDSRIFETFEKIDGRTNTHERDVVGVRARLVEISSEMNALRDQLVNFSSDDAEEETRRKRRALQGQIINLSAEYLAQSYKLVDSAAKVISENLADLAKLAAAVRASDDPTGGARKLQKRIRQNVAAGRSMRNALVQMRDWARQDPNLAYRFDSLRRIAMTLDRRITVDKTRLAGSHMDSTGAIRNKRLEALDQSVDRLSDMYAQVSSEKEALKDLRDEVAIAIQLGRLELTQEVAEKAVPNFVSIKAPTGSEEPLKNLAGVITDLNQSLATDTTELRGQRATAPGKPRQLKIEGFSNF